MRNLNSAKFLNTQRFHLSGLFFSIVIITLLTFQGISYAEFIDVYENHGYYSSYGTDCYTDGHFINRCDATIYIDVVMIGATSGKLITGIKKNNIILVSKGDADGQFSISVSGGENGIYRIGIISHHWIPKADYDFLFLVKKGKDNGSFGIDIQSR